MDDSLSPKLLLVDGSVQSADLISFWLRTEDLQIFTSETGDSALVKLDFLRPDIAIVNTDLPDMSGFDLCKRIKEQSEETQVLCVSNMESESYRLRAEQMGADDYIETGADDYLFISKVRSLLRVKRLSGQLRLRYAELEEKNNLINRQLEMGMQVQRALIPEINMHMAHCDMRSRYYPAMGVGGDFYNVLSLPDGRFGIVMGDVSGHGIAAAFLTALLNMMIKNLSLTILEPHLLLYHLNNELCAMFEHSEASLYACVFYAVVNTRGHYVRYSNAGQSSPLYVDATRNTVIELALAGTPVGMLKDSQYQIESIMYNPADLLLLHTDGLQDLFYKEQPDEFTRRMKELLSDMRFTHSLDEILDAVCDQFYLYSASETARMEMDDVSMILCRFS